jgi:hypothetical protein
MAFDNGHPFTLGTTQTFVSPTVVPLGFDEFGVFHTGTDGRIYYADVAAPPRNWNLDVNDVWSGNWFNVPGQTTNMPVSVVQFRPNSFDLYMVYRGSGQDERVYGAWNDDNGWHFGGNIGGGDALSAPSITFNNETQEGGTLGRGPRYGQPALATHQPVGASSWPSWTPMVIDILGTDLHPRFATFDPFMNRLTNWTVDASGFQTFGSVTLTANQEVIYGLIDGLDGIGYWKVVYNNPNGEL